MRTTVDLPDELFREAKTRAVQEGTTLKQLLTAYIRAGLRGRSNGILEVSSRRRPPPVAIAPDPEKRQVSGLSNRELQSLIDAEDAIAHAGKKR